MPWRPLDHTADAGVVVTGGDRETLFAEAVRALTDCITEVACVRPRHHRAIELSADELDLLLVDWLSEALYLFDTDGFLAARASLAIVERRDAGWRLSGELLGEPHDPARHPHKVAIKAITYHGLTVSRTAEGWRARLIFDI